MAGPLAKIEPFAVISSVTNRSKDLFVRKLSRNQLWRAHIPLSPSTAELLRIRSAHFRLHQAA